MKPLRYRWPTLAVLLALPLVLISNAGWGAQDYRDTLVENGRRLRLEISAEFAPRQREDLVAWINFIAAALLDVYGHWPRQQWQVSVQPAAAAARDPIPWAQVHRGKIDRVEFFTAPHATLAALQQDWTGYHELAHLLIPYRGWGDTWFSEGVASFYQNILQARAGVLPEQQAWQNLYDGFMRGIADSKFNGQPLSDVSDAMREKGGFMRVYWSGAWYFLAIDVRLRQQSGGAINLDRALAKLNECCADDHLSVQEMVNKLDELNEVLLFAPLYEQVRASTTMPPFERIFASLGITVADGTVTLQQEGPGAALRRQIVQPKPL
jgi:hypothetical protein